MSSHNEVVDKIKIKLNFLKTNIFLDLGTDFKSSLLKT